MRPAPADRLVVPDHIVTREVRGALVLLNAETGQYFALDEVGRRAWTVLVASPSVEDARLRLADEYTVDPSELARDLEALIGALVERGLIEVRHG